MSFIKNVKIPRLVESKHFGTRRISVINAGKNHSGALTEDGELYTWGHGADKSKCPPGYLKVISAFTHNTSRQIQNVPLHV